VMASAMRRWSASATSVMRVTLSVLPSMSLYQLPDEPPPPKSPPPPEKPPPPPSKLPPPQLPELPPQPPEDHGAADEAARRRAAAARAAGLRFAVCRACIATMTTAMKMNSARIRRGQLLLPAGERL